jgi:hypothetical protein
MSTACEMCRTPTAGGPFCAWCLAADRPDLAPSTPLYGPTLVEQAEHAAQDRDELTSGEPAVWDMGQYESEGTNLLDSSGVNDGDVYDTRPS